MRTRTTLGFVPGALALAATFASGVAAADGPAPAPSAARTTISLDVPGAAPSPPAADPPPGARWGVALAGLGSTAAWYGVATGFSYWFPDAPGASDLRVPVIGPWQAIAHNGCGDEGPDCSRFPVVFRTILTTIDGIGQAGGLLVLGEALLLRTAPAGEKPVRRTDVPAPTGGDKLFYTPVPLAVGRSGIGVGVVGSF